MPPPDLPIPSPTQPTTYQLHASIENICISPVEDITSAVLIAILAMPLDLWNANEITSQWDVSSAFSQYKVLH